jgi:hypothetical protein
VLFAASKDKGIPIKTLYLMHKKISTPCVSIRTYASLGVLLAAIKWKALKIKF